jgi:hypothetical protein
MTISMHHESVAGFVADVYYRARHRVAPCHRRRDAGLFAEGSVLTYRDIGPSSYE